MRGFRPFGMEHCKNDPVTMTMEGYESLRMINYEMLSQDETALRMNVSRPTVTRIYNKAIAAITRAFVEGREIHIEGGNYVFDKDWFKCKRCHKLIEGQDAHTKCLNCNDFGANELVCLNDARTEK